jgi:hypothetical protein
LKHSGTQYFYGYHAAEIFLHAQVDVCHTALAEFLFDPVAGNRKKFGPYFFFGHRSRFLFEEIILPE